MNISLIITLWTDDDGQERFRVDYPHTETDLEDVTSQFDLSVVTMPNGQMGFTVFRKEA